MLFNMLDVCLLTAYISYTFQYYGICEYIKINKICIHIETFKLYKTNQQSIHYKINYDQCICQEVTLHQTYLTDDLIYPNISSTMNSAYLLHTEVLFHSNLFLFFVMVKDEPQLSKLLILTIITSLFINSLTTITNPYILNHL